jgi:hypothetical protein
MDSIKISTDLLRYNFAAELYKALMDVGDLQPTLQTFLIATS